MAKTGFLDRKWFVLHHPYKGMGNKMGTDVPAFVICLMQNRSLVVDSNYPLQHGGMARGNAYDFPPAVLARLTDLPRQLQAEARAVRNLPEDRGWACFDLRTVAEERFVGFNDLLYAPMVYVNAQTARFAVQHFGLHAAHFISNYLSRLTNSSLQEALAILNRTRAPVLGVHARFHRAGQYYSHGLNQTLPVLFEEIDRRLRRRRDLQIALATDSAPLLEAVKRRYPHRVLSSEAVRGPDRDHFSAMVDMQMVMGADDLLLTYRSSFSWIIAARVGRSGAWWIEKEALHCWPLSGSQVGGISMVYHWRDHCDWRTNDRVELCNPAHREVLATFFRNLVL